MLKKYKLSFDIWGLLLFLIIMIPNFIWFLYPAPNDVLRADSVTGGIDSIASVSQVLMVMVLCIFVNKERCKLRMSSLIIITLICGLLYFACWISYYYIGIDYFPMYGIYAFCH